MHWLRQLLWHVQPAPSWVRQQGHSNGDEGHIHIIVSLWYNVESRLVKANAVWWRPKLDDFKKLLYVHAPTTHIDSGNTILCSAFSLPEFGQFIGRWPSLSVQTCEVYSSDWEHTTSTGVYASWWALHHIFQSSRYQSHIRESSRAQHSSHSCSTIWMLQGSHCKWGLGHYPGCTEQTMQYWPNTNLVNEDGRWLSASHYAGDQWLFQQGQFPSSQKEAIVGPRLKKPIFDLADLKSTGQYLTEVWYRNLLNVLQ